MSSPDRNLLFGILALQMDFISRDALIAAMHAWVLEKTKPLGQILVEQDVLTAKAREKLEAVVELHLEMHGGDPQKSLAVLSAIGSVRQELQKFADAELDHSLAQVSAARPEEDPWATRPPAVGDPSVPGLRFRIKQDALPVRGRSDGWPGTPRHCARVRLGLLSRRQALLRNAVHQGGQPARCDSSLPCSRWGEA
jgi:hypothetical protein